MSKQIKIEDGLKTYDLVNKKGELLCQITFNPSDTDIVRRHEEVTKQLNKLKNDVMKRGRKKKFVDELEEIDNIVYEKIDYLFDAKIAESIFSIMGPFSPLASGQFFVEHILDVLTKIMMEENEGLAKKMESKISKYTTKYHK